MHKKRWKQLCKLTKMIINDEKRLQNDDCGDIMNSQTKTTTNNKV